MFHATSSAGDRAEHGEEHDSELGNGELGTRSLTCGRAEIHENPMISDENPMIFDDNWAKSLGSTP